jgi:hypothetical protein
MVLLLVSAGAALADDNKASAAAGTRGPLAGTKHYRGCCMTRAAPVCRFVFCVCACEGECRRRLMKKRIMTNEEDICSLAGTTDRLVVVVVVVVFFLWQLNS